MADGKQTYTLEVLGRKITVQSDSDAEHVREVQRLVQEHFDTVREAARGADAVESAILVALNLADDHVKTRRSLERSTRGVSERIGRIRALVDARL